MEYNKKLLFNIVVLGVVYFIQLWLIEDYIYKPLFKSIYLFSFVVFSITVTALNIYIFIKEED